MSCRNRSVLGGVIVFDFGSSKPMLSSAMTATTESGTAVVTGAAGFIGCHLCEALVEEGWRVRAIDDERTGDWARLRVPVERLHRDFAAASPRELGDMCDGADVLFHLAAEKYNSSRATPERVLAVNVSGTQRLFEAAARAGVSKTVFTSSLYAYGALGPDPMRETDVPAPWTTYGVSKLAGEHLLRTTGHDHGMRWAVARLFFVYGPRQFAEGGYRSVILKNFERVREGLPPVINGDGEQALDYFFVSDCVDGLLAMAGPSSDGHTLNLGSGRAVSINELTGFMLEVSASELTPVRAPPDWTAETVRFGDVTLALLTLGWRASVELPEGLARTWNQ
jgi:UDP-glucose 4-epimerase